jgi:hypothetical protein
MAYDVAKYNALISLEVPYKIALALASDSAPRVGAARPAIADLAGGADLPTTVAKVNALLASLRAAGIIAS